MKRFEVSAEIRARILVGAVTFVTLTILEVALSISLFRDLPAPQRGRAPAIRCVGLRRLADGQIGVPYTFFSWCI
jgi:hypothetical protein